MVDSWNNLVSKTRNRLFLGTLDFRGTVIKKYKDYIVVSLESRYRNSGLMLLISSIFFFVITCKAYPYSIFAGILFLLITSIVLSIIAVPLLAYRRRIVLNKPKRQICFLWGIYPFVKTFVLDSSKLYVGIENVQRKSSQDVSIIEQIFLMDEAKNKMAIVKSKKYPAMIQTAFQEMGNFIKVIT